MARKYSVKIDNKKIAVKDGFVLKEELNETLDSGTIVFLNKGGEANIDPFDSVVIEGTGIERKKLLVDTFQAEIENFNDDLALSDYLYTINLFSETKLLERITLPNLAITKRANGTARTVWDVIKSYCKRYLPYIKVYKSLGHCQYKCSIKYDETMETKFNMECPEFIWNTPTLKEVLIDLMSVADCIPVVKDNVLTYFDLTYKGNAIDTTKLINRTISKTSADYCDSLTLPMKNVISKQRIVVSEMLLPHAPIGTGEMTSNNAVYITKKPIYKIRKCFYYIYSYAPTETLPQKYKLYEYDITEAIKERKDYDLLSNEIMRTSKLKADALKYKACNLYYERGQTTINGIGEGFKFGTTTHSKHAFIGACFAGSVFPGSLNNYELYGYDAPFIMLEYETISEDTISVSKENKIKNSQNALFDSQSANSVDLEHQTIFEYAKANRLSSMIEQIEGVYESESDIPKLGDYIGNKILFSKEVSYFDDIYIFKGQLCENYILRNYFTGVNAKERSWNIVDTNEAILRNDVYKFFMNYTTRNPINIYEMTEADNTIPYSVYGDIYSELVSTRNFQPLKNGAVFTADGEGNRYPEIDITYYEYASIDIINFTGEKNITIFASQNDNFSFGDQVVKNDDIYTMNALPYTDSNGECVRYDLYVAHLIDPLAIDGKRFNTEIEKLKDPSRFDKDNYDDVLEVARKHPIVGVNIVEYMGNTNHNLKMTARFNKDNREIVSSTLQFEYVSDDENVIINDGIAQVVNGGNGQLLTGTWTPIGRKVVRNHHYKKGDTTPLGDNFDTYSEIVSERPYARLKANQNVNSTDAWCLYSTKTGKILLAVNGSDEVNVYIDIVRDEKVYNNVIDKKEIGSVFSTTSELYQNYEANPPEITEIKVLDRIIDVEDLKDF